MTLTIKQLTDYSWMSQASYLDFSGLASVGRISLRNPPDENMTHILKSSQKPPPTDNATLIRPT